MLYKNEDGFSIEKRPGSIHYIAKKLQEAIEKYGISKNPNIDEMTRIAKKIQTYIGQLSYSRAIEAPVYPNDSYLSGILRVVSLMIQFESQNIKDQPIIENYYRMVLYEIEKEDESYLEDIRTR